MYLSEVARRLDLHPNTFLQYVDLGLHDPERDPDNNYRIDDEIVNGQNT